MSSLGHSGNGFLSYATDLTISVGLSAPNVNPTEVVDPVGQRTLTLSPISGGGVTLEEGYRPSSRSVDNSWLSHGGCFTVHSGNKIEFKTGSGGFKMDSCGPMWLNTSGFDIFTGRVNIKAEELSVGVAVADISAKEIHARGKTTFYENAAFCKNVVINGGLFVNGETFNTHTTSVGQEQRTKPSEPFSGVINPAQSFMVFDGCSGIAKTTIKSPWKANGELPSDFGYINAVIALPIPGVEGIYQVPCKLVFPNGISICSDNAAQTMGIESITELALCPKRVPDPEMPDFDGPGHSHIYIGSGGEAVDGSADFATSAAACMQDKPVTAKPSQEVNAEKLAKGLVEAHVTPAADWLLGKESYIRNLIKRFTGV